MQDVKTDRNKYIGGSDIPIIMGISPYKKRFDLLLEKAELKEDVFEGNAYTEYGNIMEPKIRDYINKSQDRNFIEGKHINDDIRCHTDGEDETTVLEIKTTSNIYDTVDEYKIYLVQLLFYMMNTNRKEGLLAIYERPDNFKEEFEDGRLKIYAIHIEDYKNLCEDIKSAVDNFRIDLERVKENPLITEEELMPNDLKLLLKDFISNKKMIDSLTNDNKLIIDKIEPLIKKAGKQTFEIENVKATFTYGSIGTTKIEEEFNLEKFKLENEDLYKQYIEEVEKKSKSSSNNIKISSIKGRN